MKSDDAMLLAKFTVFMHIKLTRKAGMTFQLLPLWKQKHCTWWYRHRWYWRQRLHYRIYNIKEYSRCTLWQTNFL